MIVQNIINGGRNNMKQFNLDKYLKNPNRKVITRDGRNVRIVCTDRRGLNVKPIAALITIPNGDEIIKTYWENGVETQGYKNNPNDLFFAPEKKEGWVNIYLDAENSGYVETCIYKSKEEAEESGKKWSRYITTIKIEWEE